MIGTAFLGTWVYNRKLSHREADYNESCSKPTAPEPDCMHEVTEDKNGCDGQPW